MAKITGIDVSEAQGAVNWTVTRQHAAFVYIKASQGASLVDPSLKANWEGAGEVGLPRGLVHVFHPLDLKDWKQQLESILSLVVKFPCEMPTVLDLQSDGGLRKSEMDNIGAKFIKRYAENVGEELIIRTNGPFFDKNLPLTDWAKHRKLWVVDTSGGDEPAVPREWSKQKPPWVLWQYSGRENALGAAYGLSSRYVELTRFFGDKKRFNRLFGVMVTTVEPPKPGERPPQPVSRDAIQFFVDADSVDVHISPGTHFPKVGELEKGDRVALLDMSAEGDVWIQIADGKWVAWKIDGKRKLRRDR